MPTHQEHLLLEHLAQYVSDHKKQLIEKVLDLRTRQVTVVFEDIYQSQNASAGVRTCEGMGLQDIHIIENQSQYQVNRKVLKGANKWVNLVRHNDKDHKNTERCFQHLRENGYTIFALDPSPDGISVQSVDPLLQKCALVFGNELNGLSATARKLCDQKVHIPMQGFTESYNISVSVAVCLTLLMNKLRSENCFIGLSEEEKHTVRLQWYLKVVKRSEIIVREFMRTFK